jgi:hypothetical protein
MDNQSYIKTIEELEETLSQLKTETQYFVELTEKAMGLCDSVMMELRESVLKNGFNSEEEEIYFFKHVKPKVESKFFFYTELFKLEANRPEGGKKVQIRYLRDEVLNLCVYQKENKELYFYFKGNKVYSDQIYFLRGNLDSRIHEDNLSCHTDPNFCTGYDRTLARIMAYKQLGKYIGNEIRKLTGETEYKSSLFWTGFKVHAIVLVYALYFMGVINNGQADIAEIARVFEKMFNIDLKNYYSVFNKQIKGKKKDRSEFLRKLLETFERRLNESDK